MRRQLIVSPVLLAIITIGLVLAILRHRPHGTVRFEIRCNPSSQPFFPTTMTVTIGSIKELPPEQSKKLVDDILQQLKDPPAATKPVSFQIHFVSGTDKH
jgi:hypothetical protein